MLNISYFSLAALFVVSVTARAQDSAVFDAQSGAWRLYYQDTETAQWISKTYVQQNAIKPNITSAVRWNGQQFSYQYRVSNRSDAKQTIDLFRIWGIPLVYTVPNLPPITIDVKTDPEGEDRQQWAQLKEKRKFQNEVVKAPKGWSAGLRVDAKDNQTSFVWTPGLKEGDPDGIPPGSSQGGFMVARTELPGVARAKLTGWTAEPWGLDNLPDTPFWSQKVDEIQDLDFVLVPVLAPVIVVPEPYNGAELARRLKAHTQTWLKFGHITTDALDRLNRQFDVLIPALESNNKPTARVAAIAMFREVFECNPGLNHHKLGEDDAGQFAGVLPHKYVGRQITIPTSAIPPVAVQRVAARALAFDLMYLLTRMEIGR